MPTRRLRLLSCLAACAAISSASAVAATAAPSAHAPGATVASAAAKPLTGTGADPFATPPATGVRPPNGSPRLSRRA